MLKVRVESQMTCSSLCLHLSLGVLGTDPWLTVKISAPIRASTRHGHKLLHIIHDLTHTNLHVNLLQHLALSSSIFLVQLCVLLYHYQLNYVPILVWTLEAL